MNQPKTLALLISPREHWSSLVELLAALGLEILTVESCREARSWLRIRPPLDLIMTHASLSDGNWCDVIKLVVDDGIDVPIVVCSPTANERLWAEVVWRGAYDLLAGPPELRAVRTVVEGALGISNGEMEKWDSLNLQLLASSSSRN